MNTITAKAAPWMLTLLTIALVSAARAEDDEPQPIEIAAVQREDPVDFEKEILPILKKSCLACHNQAEASGDLVLETPQSILKGGENGATVSPGNGDKSLLLKVASRREEPSMPPEDNDVDAAPLTPAQLGLIKVWIDQGAKGKVTGQSAPLAWQPLPPGINPIYAVSVSPDGQYVACGRANQIFVYHVRSGQLVDRLTDPHLVDAGIYKNAGVAHLDIVQSLEFSPDGRTLASGGYRVVKLWRRPENPTAAKPFVFDHDVRRTAISADGKMFATVDDSGHIRLLTLGENQREIELVDHQGTPVGLQFTDDGKTLVTASEDGALRIWNTGDGRLQSRIDTPSSISAMTLASGTQQVVVAGGDAKLRALAIPTVGARQLLAATDFSVATASPDGKWLAIAGSDGTVHVLSLGAENVLKTWKAHEGAITALAFRSDSAELMTAADDHQLKLWGAGPWNQTATVEMPARTLTAACALGDGRRFAVGDSKGRIVVWNVDTMDAPTAIVEGPESDGAAAAIVDMVTASDGSVIYAATRGHSVRVLSTDNGEVRYTIDVPGNINGLAISSDGAVLATAGEDQQVRLWNAADGQPAGQPVLAGFAAPVVSLAFADQRQLVAGSSDGRVVVFDITTGIATQAFSRHEGAVAFAAVLPGASPMAITGVAGQSFMQWPILANHVVSLPSPNVTAVVALSGEGLQVVVANTEGTARQWDLVSGKVVKEFKHGAAITAVAVTTDGTRLATSGEDQVIRSWNMADGSALAEIRGDQRANREQARVAAVVAVAKTKDDQAKQKATEAAKTLEGRIAALEKANTERDTAIAAVGPIEQADTKAKAEKVAAEKLATDTTAAAKKAAEAKTAADGVATLAIKNAAAASETAAASIATHDQLTAAIQSATTAFEKAKAAATLLPEDQQLAAIVTATNKTLDGAKALAAPAKASRLAAEKLAAERKAASEVAVKNQKAAEQAVVDSAAAAKAAQEKLAAANKAAEVAQKALTDATNKKAAAVRTASDADAARKRADHAVATTKQKATETGAFLASRSELAKATQERAATGQTVVRSLAFSGDNLQLAAAGDNGLVQTFRADNAAPIGTYEGHTGAVIALRYLDAHRLVSSAGDKKVQTWDLASHWTLQQQIGPPLDAPTSVEVSPLADRVLALDFSPDGQLLATGGGEPSRSGELKIWNVSDGSLNREFVDSHSDTVFGVAFSSDGRYLASSSADKFVKVFDVASGTLLRSYEGHTHHVLGVDWQYDGTVLASCGADKVVKVWNFESGEQQRTIGGFGKQVTSITFVGTAAEIVTSSADKTVRLHTIGDGKNVRNFGGCTDYMYSVAVSADGSLVVAGGADSVLRLWNKADGKVVATFEPPPRSTQQTAATK